ncbi:MAG: ATPase, T2SS/T4P/T4SS family [Acidimicrobiales bacterium]
MNGVRTGSTYERLRRATLDQMARRGLDVADSAAVLGLIRGVVADYEASASAGSVGRPLGDPSAMVDRLARSVFEFGPLTPFLDGSLRYEELIIHGEEVSYVDDAGRLIAHSEPVSEEEVAHVVAKLLASVGATADELHPVVQTQILGGSARLGVVLPPIAERIDVTIRRYLTRRETLAELVEWESLTKVAASFLSVLLAVPTGVIVTGQPGSGKTTLLNAMLRSAPSTRRVIVCEDTPELSTDHLHAARWRTRTAGPEGVGEVSLRDLVRMSLGMRPDLVVIGETRGGEAYELTRAGNAGCGMLSTIHANGARQGLMALISTATMSGTNVTAEQMRHVFSSIVDVVVHTSREGGPSGRRQIAEIVAVPAMQATEHDITVEPIFTRSGSESPLVWTGAPLPDDLANRIDRGLRHRGFRVEDVLEGRVDLL